MLRVEALGSDYTRAAAPAELDMMGSRLREALEQGALGLSTGLAYPTSRASTTAEVVQLASQIADMDNAVYATHIRNESNEVLESLDEAFTIGRQSGLPVIISHHKCSGRQNHGRAIETMAAVEQAARHHPSQRRRLPVYRRLDRAIRRACKGRDRGADRGIHASCECCRSQAGRHSGRVGS